MDFQKINEARKEAAEFIKRADAVIQIGMTQNIYDHPVETGALRRQSMELTRALAKMRRP